MSIGAKRGTGHDELWIDRGRVLSRKIEWIAGILVEIDELLEAWGMVLEVSQPPVTGKLGLRWWKVSGKDEMREPVLVEWRIGRGGRFFPKKVEVNTFCRMVKRSGGFRVNAGVTREVAHYVVEMLRVREMLKVMLVDRRDGGALKRHVDVIGFQSARAVELLKVLRAR